MTFTAKAFIVCDLGRRGTDISRLPVTPFNTVINPDVTNWWSGAGAFPRPPLCRAFMDFYPPWPLLGLTVTIVLAAGDGHIEVVILNISGTLWSREEMGTLPSPMVSKKPVKSPGF